MPPLLELRSHKSYGSGHLLLVRFASVFYEKGPMVPQQRWAWLGRENSVKHRGMGLGVSKLGSNVGTAVIPAGGHMFMPQGVGNDTCQILCSWRGCLMVLSLWDIPWDEKITLSPMWPRCFSNCCFYAASLYLCWLCIMLSFKGRTPLHNALQTILDWVHTFFKIPGFKSCSF